MFFLKNHIKKAAISIAVMAAFLLMAPLEARCGDVTVLIYHRFGDERYPTTNVPMANFQAQMEYPRENGYQVIPLAEMAGKLSRGEELPDKSVVITVDDGYRSVYEKGWPILKSFGYPFTVFLYVRGTDKGHHDYMTWEQIREMQTAGVDFQAHGYGHYRMADRPTGMDNEAYRAWIRSDLSTAARIMTRQLGVKPRFFAVPYGEYNKTVINEARDLNFEAILMQDPGSVSEDTDVFAIPREPILGEEWITLKHFKKILERVDLPFVDMAPAIEPLKTQTPARFAARLLYPDRYRLGTLGIYVSELGWRPAGLQENGMLSLDNTLPLTRRLNRVAISGREKESGRTAIRFWLLIRENCPEPEPMDPAGMIMKKD